MNTSGDCLLWQQGRTFGLGRDVRGERKDDGITLTSAVLPTKMHISNSSPLLPVVETLLVEASTGC